MAIFDPRLVQSSAAAFEAPLGLFVRELVAARSLSYSLNPLLSLWPFNVAVITMTF